MSSQKQQFGMMDEGYFVPKSQILSWINDLLKINISKIEALGSGSIYCQIFDVIHPGKISLSKVNWKARNDVQFLKNFQLLQSALEKIGIKRHIQVEKLVKAKYQDNLQFIQWLKRYFDLNCGSKGEGYDAVQKRNKVVPDFGFAEKIVVPKMYNGTGQVILKDKLVSPNKKKQQIPQRVKSPKAVTTPASNNRIKTPAIEKKQEIKKKPAQPIKKTHQPIKKVQHTNHIGPKNHINLTSDQKLKKELETKINVLQEKFDMIKQVVNSAEDSNLKVNLIKEILQITKKQQTHKIQEKNTAAKQDDISSAVEQQSNQNQLLSVQNYQEQEKQEVSDHPVSESQQNAELSQNNQTQLLEEKPELQNAVPSEQDDDII